MKAPGSPSSALQMTYLWSPGGQAGEAPLHAGEEAGAAAAAQAGLDDAVDQAVGVLLREHLAQGLVAADREVVVDDLGVDAAAVAQHDPVLAREVGALAADLAVAPDQPVRDRRAARDVLGEEAVDLLGGHAAVLPDRARVVDDLDQRLAVAHAEAAGLAQVERGAAVARPRRQGAVDLAPIPAAMPQVPRPTRIFISSRPLRWLAGAA